MDTHAGADAPFKVNVGKRKFSGISFFSEEQKRAIVQKHPNPFALMDFMLGMAPGDAMYEIAQIQTGTGKRIGPALAQKIFYLLTSLDGSEILFSS